MLSLPARQGHKKEVFIIRVTLTTEITLIASLSVQKKYIVKIMPGEGGNKIVFFVSDLCPNDPKTNPFLLPIPPDQIGEYWMYGN